MLSVQIPGPPAKPNGDLVCDRHEQQPTESQDDAGAGTNNVASDERRIQARARSNTQKSRTRQSPDSPSARTGPPRSLSYNFSLSHAHGLSPTDTTHEALESDQGSELVFAPMPGDTSFRSVLDYDKKGKRRESATSGHKWGRVHDSPIEETEQFDWAAAATNKDVPAEEGELSNSNRSSQIKSVPSPSARTQRSLSVPGRTGAGAAKWTRLRSLLPHLKRQREPLPGPSAVTSQSVNITDELITGGLATLMLRLWVERDENDKRRVSVLLHRLRIRVSDSLHPLHGHNTVFRIECEYANGAARWVIYRQLRDFITLHTHYSLSNAYSHNVDQLPRFPRTSKSYFRSSTYHLRASCRSPIFQVPQEGKGAEWRKDGPKGVRANTTRGFGKLLG